jgi:hypothetical protein
MGLQDLEISEEQFLNCEYLEFAIKLDLGSKKWVTVHVMRGDETIHDIILFHNGDFFSAFNRGLDYKAYDKHIKEEVAVMPCKAQAAALRLMHPIDLSSEYEKYYRTYIQENFLGLFHDKEMNVDTIQKYYDAGFLTFYHLDQLLKIATEKDNVEVSSLLIKLMQRKKDEFLKPLDL